MVSTSRSGWAVNNCCQKPGDSDFDFWPVLFDQGLSVVDVHRQLRLTLFETLLQAPTVARVINGGFCALDLDVPGNDGSHAVGDGNVSQPAALFDTGGSACAAAVVISRRSAKSNVRADIFLPCVSIEEGHFHSRSGAIAYS